MSPSLPPRVSGVPVNEVERETTFQFASNTTVEPSRVSVPPANVPSAANSKTRLSSDATVLPSASKTLKLPVSTTYSLPPCLSEDVPVAATVSLRFSHSFTPSLPPSPRNSPAAFS